jgi:F-type H+-transporting ATPase subunit c
MDASAAKLIGAGLAAMGVIGAGIGIGNVWGSWITAVARNPAAKNVVQTNTWIGFALVEAVALYALAVAFMILYG